MALDFAVGILETPIILGRAIVVQNHVLVQRAQAPHQRNILATRRNAPARAFTSSIVL
jgi:hypothetical protein